jgi:hypothetical protein
VKDKLAQHAKDAGAKTTADLGFFLAGVFIGGVADAMANIAGFADPMVFAPICGAGSLALKKLCWDSWHEKGQNGSHAVSIESILKSLKAEAEYHRKQGYDDLAKTIDDAVEAIEVNQLTELEARLFLARIPEFSQSPSL